MFVTLAVCFGFLGLISVILVRRNPDFTEHKEEVLADQLNLKEAIK